MEKNTLIFAVGGTGGHLYPAIALADRLSQLDPTLSIHFVGGGIAAHRHLEGTPFAFKEVSSGTLSFRKPFVAASNAIQILKGVRQSYQFIRDCRPTLVVGFGSYHAFPTLAAAKLANVPIVLHEQNSVPGRVNRFISRYAALTGVYFPSAGRRLKGTSIVVEMPLRAGYQYGAYSKEEAKRQLGLDPNRPVVLVFGGSQGARRINQLVLDGLDGRPLQDLQFLHLTGDARFTALARQRYQAHGVPAVVKDYETRMDLAWSAADLVVSRAGAGSIAEQIEFEVPGILIPYPFAMDSHQDANADFIVQQIGGAVKMEERCLGAAELMQGILDQFQTGKLTLMRRQIRDYKSRRTTLEFSEVIRSML